VISAAFLYADRSWLGRSARCGKRVPEHQPPPSILTAPSTAVRRGPLACVVSSASTLAP